ncbi:MAG: Fe-S cluster assembly protein SufD [Patescibacteria group bacterium]|nr:Fe-S cluster assembly protein SufD [Patescibacteria group bacterium]
MKIINLTDSPIKQRLEFTEDENILLVSKSSGDADLEIILNAEGITVNVFGIVFLQKNEHLKLKTKSIHAVPNTFSRVHLKGVFADSSKMDYEGLIKIDKNAQLSDAYLQNDNLLIGDNAVVNSSPQLEICADDVKASHGVTISSFEDEYVYYLMSRGLDESTSRQMLVHGFLNDIIKKIDIDHTLELVQLIPALKNEEL